MTWLTPSVPVPSQNSADNNYIQEVVGNKTDTHVGNSLYAYGKAVYEHVNASSKVYPTLAAGVTVVAGAAWVLGDFIEIVPASTITTNFMIHNIGVEALSANDTYELVLYKGAESSEIEVGRVRFAKNSNFDAIVNQPFQTAIILANERISAKIASAGGTSTATISIFYHVH